MAPMLILNLIFSLLQIWCFYVHSPIPVRPFSSVDSGLAYSLSFWTALPTASTCIPFSQPISLKLVFVPNQATGIYWRSLPSTVDSKLQSFTNVPAKAEWAA